MAMPRRPGLWAFISKDRFSATSGGACIRRKIWLRPTVEIFERLWQAARGHVKMLTIAPEIPGAMEVIAEAARAEGLREHRALGR